MSSFGTIHLFTPDGVENVIQLTQAELSIGRAPQCQLVLADALVSQYHARITIQEKGVWLTDLGSTNGTYLNNQRLIAHQPTLLSTGMEIQMGDSRLHITELPIMSQSTLPPQPPSTPVPSRWAGFIIGSLMALAVGILIWGIWLLQRPCCTPAIPTVESVATNTSATITTIPVSAAISPCPQPRLVGVSLIGQSQPTVDGLSISTILPNSVALARPVPAIPFLELPFPYQTDGETFGGSDEQFRQVMQRTAAGGRINSFFDHLFPLYPAPQQPSVAFGREPIVAPFGGAILLFNGLLSENDYYSGHPAYDFSPSPPRQATTPVFAAADGLVSEVGTHSSGALFVRLLHVLPEVGAFQTTYWHLAEDEHFVAMLEREGEQVSAGTRLGTMGNTGWSTGHHLHFEVRFDRNEDGRFTAEETVDPFGYIPNPAYPADPWAQSSTFTDAQGQSYSHTGSLSPYLWIHPLGLQVAVPAEGGHITDEGIGGEGMALCVPAGSLPGGSLVYAAWSPDPSYNHTLVGTGNGYVLSVIQGDGTPVITFNGLIRVEIPFDATQMSLVDPTTLLIYRLETGRSDWVALPTTLDWDQGLAVAETDRPGYFALMGFPVRDIVAPQTTIEVVGQPGIDGVWYDTVTVTLLAEDPSGISQLEYSLDAGTTWQPYTAPFSLQADGIPEPMPELLEEDFGSGPGRFLVLAAAQDSAGNLQNPPSFKTIIIDPSKKPDQSGTLTPTSVPSVTTTLCLPIVSPIQNANVRRGPGTLYNIVADLRIGETAAIIGRNNDSSWWRIEMPTTTSTEFWIANSIVSLPCDVSSVPIVPTPVPPTLTPTPTFTPTPTPTPTTTPTVSPTITSTPVVTSTPTLIPDRIAPVVVISHFPKAPTSSESVTLTATATDNVGVTRIEIWVQGPGDTIPVLLQVCLNTTTCTVVVGPYPVQSLVTYLAYGWDATGNLGESQLGRFVVSSSP